MNDVQIIFDLSVCQPIGNSKFHGGGVYGYILYKALLNFSPSRIVAYIDKNRFIPEDILGLFSQHGLEVINSNLISLYDLYQSGKYSFIYSPLYKKSYNELINKGVKVVVTIHGLRALEMNRDKYEYMYANSIKDTLKSHIKQTCFFYYLHKKYLNDYAYFFNHKNSSIITISQHSKSSLLYYYPFLKDKTIPIFYSPSTTNIDISTVLPFNNNGYYLIISADRWLKNSYRAIQALDTLYAKFPHKYKRTIVVGLKKETKIYKKIKHKECFDFINYVDADVLESLYRGAYIFIYPTLNEGFGYPPLEAMKYGVPVISSSFSSVPEVCGDSVIYFNPYSKDEIANRIIQLEDKHYYEIYSKKSLKRYEYITEKQKIHLNKLVDYLLKMNTLV